MSYYKCKYISLDKKHNKVNVTIASNNVFPLYWEKCEIYTKEEYSYEDKLLSLFVDMEQGNLHISTINNNTVNFQYALDKVIEYHRENNIDSYEDLYKECGRLFESDKDLTRIEVYRQVYGNSFEVFRNALAEKIDGEYMVAVYNYSYVTKLGKYDRGYCRFYYGRSPLKMSYKQAYILYHDMNNDSRNMRIEKFDSEVA